MQRNIINVIPNSIGLIGINRRSRTDKEKSIHKSLKFVLVLAQCFAIFPVNGILNPNVTDLQFRWKSWKTIYSILFGCLVFILIIVHLLIIRKDGFKLSESSLIGFYLIILSSNILFIKLSMKWPSLMKKWESIDMSFKFFGWTKSLDFRLKIITITVMIFALIELTVIVSVNGWVQINSKCTNETLSIYEQFLNSFAYTGLLKVVKYSPYFAIFYPISRILTIFNWCFTDLFIVLISIPLALRFRQLNNLIKTSIIKKVSDRIFWRFIREDYNKLCLLTELVDNHISSLTLLSFISNLYFILIQLFNTLRYRDKYIMEFYYYVSLFLLILRTSFVSLYAAWVNDESKNLCYLLHKTPESIYNIEISRFIDQIHFTEIALTGMNFFNVTRGIILSMAGAIVTYELALIQFNENILENNNYSSTKNNDTCYY